MRSPCSSANWNAHRATRQIYSMARGMHTKCHRAPSRTELPSACTPNFVGACSGAIDRSNTQHSYARYRLRRKQVLVVATRCSAPKDMRRCFCGDGDRIQGPVIALHAMQSWPCAIQLINATGTRHRLETRRTVTEHCSRLTLGSVWSRQCRRPRTRGPSSDTRTLLPLCRVIILDV
jgi:hypothetical protein